MPETEHAYPSNYGRGIDPVLDDVWDLLDTVEPGAIPFEVRCFLAGAMMGLVVRYAGQRRRAERSDG